MGYYVNQDLKNMPLEANFKARALVASGASKIDKPRKFSYVVPEDGDVALICVVENGRFDAAAYCYDEDEFEAFSDITDYRPKTWLLVPKAWVEQASGYPRK